MIDTVSEQNLLDSFIDGLKRRSELFKFWKRLEEARVMDHIIQAVNGYTPIDLASWNPGYPEDEEGEYMVFYSDFREWSRQYLHEEDIIELVNDGMHEGRPVSHILPGLPDPE